DPRRSEGTPRNHRIARRASLAAIIRREPAINGAERTYAPDHCFHIVFSVTRLPSSERSCYSRRANAAITTSARRPKEKPRRSERYSAPGRESATPGRRGMPRALYNMWREILWL